MNAARKGRRAEHRARALLEAAGYVVVRAAGSKGPADLVAWDTVSFRLISVKSGTKYLSAIEREAFRLVPVPQNGVREVWRFPDRCLAPAIERIASRPACAPGPGRYQSVTGGPLVADRCSRSLWNTMTTQAFPDRARRPALMVSSTYYDLAQVRHTLRDFIEDDLGYTALLSEDPTFPIEPSTSAIDNCRLRVERDADVLVLVVGHRYGSIDRRSNLSITNLEYLAAQAKGIPVLAFVHRDLLAVLARWRADPSANVSREIEDPALLPFVADITNGENGVWVQPFEFAEDIRRGVRLQLAYLMTDGLEVLRRVRQSPPWLGTLGGKSLRLAMERPEAWEYLLFAEQLLFRVGQLWEEQAQHRAGFSPGLGDDVAEPFPWIQFRVQDARRQADLLNHLINVQLPKAFGEPGTPGDPEQIAFTANSIAEVYRTLHAWRRKVMTANVDEPLSEAIPLMGRFVDDALAQIEDIGLRTLAEIERALALPEGDPGRALHLMFTFTANVEDFLGAVERILGHG